MRDYQQFLKPPAASPMKPAKRHNGHAVYRDLSARLGPIAGLRHFGRETRKHPAEQIKKIARNIDEVGFVLPILIDPQDRVVAGWALVLAAQKLGLTHVPAVTIADLSEPQLRALRLALNRLGEDAKWNANELALELSEILEIELTSISRYPDSPWARSMSFSQAIRQRRKTSSRLLTRILNPSLRWAVFGSSGRT
jgi:hypothetical protein